MKFEKMFATYNYNSSIPIYQLGARLKWEALNLEIFSLKPFIKLLDFVQKNVVKKIDESKNG